MSGIDALRMRWGGPLGAVGTLALLAGLLVLVIVWRETSGGAELEDEANVVADWRFGEAWEPVPRALLDRGLEPRLVRRGRTVSVFWYARGCDTSPDLVVAVADDGRLHVGLDRRVRGGCDDAGIAYQAELQLARVDSETPVVLDVLDEER